MTYGLAHVREGLRHNVVQHIIYIKVVDVKGPSVDVCQTAELRHGNFGIGLDPQKSHQSLPNNAARILRPAIFGIDFFSLQNMNLPQQILETVLFLHSFQNLIIVNLLTISIMILN